mmetsp:Transcript_47506/g.124505  ORF Transcript_47506/g.124505 Transcript_47506/m.124505 type:complete len:377 (+) Transcript_47506:565-1695(+)
MGGQLTALRLGIRLGIRRRFSRRPPPPPPLPLTLHDTPSFVQTTTKCGERRIARRALVRGIQISFALGVAAEAETGGRATVQGLTVGRLFAEGMLAPFEGESKFGTLKTGGRKVEAQAQALSSLLSRAFRPNRFKLEAIESTFVSVDRSPDVCALEASVALGPELGHAREPVRASLRAQGPLQGRRCVRNPSHKVTGSEASTAEGTVRTEARSRRCAALLAHAKYFDVVVYARDGNTRQCRVWAHAVDYRRVSSLAVEQPARGHRPNVQVAAVASRRHVAVIGEPARLLCKRLLVNTSGVVDEWLTERGDTVVLDQPCRGTEPLSPLPLPDGLVHRSSRRGSARISRRAIATTTRGDACLVGACFVGCVVIGVVGA